MNINHYEKYTWLRENGSVYKYNFDMNREIPSFNAIRFFEAAARHLSFTKAGEELFVTQGAVSKQIKQLEEQLGCQLFARNGPNLQLTSHGLGFQKTVSAAIDTIKQGVSELRRQSANTLRASVLPSFATNWLIPRLHELDRLEPVLSLELLPSYEKVDFSLKTDIDIAIRLGSGDWPGLYALQLTEDNMFPVCSPVIAEGINDVDDLVDATLLVEVRPYDEWSKWFALWVNPTGRRIKNYTKTRILRSVRPRKDRVFV